MTVLAGVITYIVALVAVIVVALILGLILEAIADGLSVIAVVLAWVGQVAVQGFGLIVAAFWIFAMFQGHNPLEAFSYQMWS